jgi:proteasome lid subunit RPN8/RPN11
MGWLLLLLLLAKAQEVTMAQNNRYAGDYERAATICRLPSGELIKGTEAIGDSPWSVRLNVGCPEGEVFALHHTHPGGKAELSSQDCAEARRLGIERMCVSNETKMRCYRIK